MTRFFKGLFGVFAILLGSAASDCSCANESAQPGRPPTAADTGGSRHFLADKPLKLFPDQLSEQWKREEAIRAARDRARVYRDKHARHIRPTTADPMGKRQMTLELATGGIEGAGPLKVEIATTVGKIRCTLFEQLAPEAVAHFAGLARGLRPWWDPASGTWSTIPFYAGTPIYKIRRKQIIYAGCPMGTGFAGVGFRAVLPPPRVDDKTIFSRGTLSLLKGPQLPSVGAQFAILAADNPAMNEFPYPIGTCESLETIDKIAGLKTTPEGIPLNDIVIEKIAFSR